MQNQYMKSYRIYISILSFISCSAGLFANTSISIDAPKILLETSVTQLAIEDTQVLLEKACDCTVSINQTDAEIHLQLPLPSLAPFGPIQHVYNQDSIAELYYPSTDFNWESKFVGHQIILLLNTDSYEGVSAGLYALLQEKLGFKFYHPRETIIPKWEEWPLENTWNWEVRERFHKRGFHLHTMHPIELTEALLDEEFPDNQQQIKEYIDWLARNGQNYFEFNLLNSTKIKTWIPYISEIVDYAHERGIIMGIDISLNMIQQKAYKLYKKFPNSLRTREKQIIRNLNELAQADFDVYNIEMSSTEYTSGNSGKRQKQMQLILDWADTEEVKIIGRAHVVKKGEKILNYSGEPQPVFDGKRGILIHTVMFYEISEEKAPVYGNTNLQHMNQLLEKEQQQRETWYFPESAYWVTFDNSIPMFLLPYLSARWTDIKEMEEKQIEGHLTFSSGWEWGYWLFDWSIARWSWDYGNDTHTFDPLNHLVEDDNIKQSLIELHRLQDIYFKDKELMRYLVAQSVLDEVPKKFSKEFHPRPRWRYPYLFNKANNEILDTFKNESILPLQEFILEYEKELERFKHFSKGKDNPILKEWEDGLEITLMRAQHRKYVLEAIYQKRYDQIHKIKSKQYLEYIDKAQSVRLAALEIVRNREQEYRYDQSLMSSKRKGHTAYHFGYLYPVHDLHFWEREERQVIKNKWGFPFMNIWNIWRIMGIKK